MTDALARLDKATQMLAEAKSLDEVKNIMDIAEAARTYARAAKLGLEAYNHAAEVKARAERKAGEFLKQLERGIPKPFNTLLNGSDVSEYKEVLDENGINYMAAHRWQQVAEMPEEIFEAHLEEMRGERPITTSGMITELKRSKVKTDLEDVSKQDAKALSGVYDVIVIDPPWNMEKIERDVAPNQVAFEYPTMELEEIGAVKIPCADNCHVFLWTTQKHLPSAFKLLEVWGLKYVLTFVWHKNGGFQPFNLPQYNCEFALYARKGTPQFIEFTDFMTCFNAKRTAHSEKPEEFYATLRRVTAGRRLDMFNRRTIEGFDGWGNEAK
jgi:N6-adenosine-specific RNA methylase IME4